MVSDGTLTAAGRWQAWLCSCEHPLVRVFLEPYQLGYSDEETEPPRLVDRYLGTLDVNLCDVEQLPATQPSELRALTANPAPGETRGWRNARSRSRASASKPSG